MNKILSYVLSNDFVLAISRLDSYLESGGQGAAIKPWVWISLLFVSPVVVSLSSVRYMSGIVRQYLPVLDISST